MQLTIHLLNRSCCSSLNGYLHIINFWLFGFGSWTYGFCIVVVAVRVYVYGVCRAKGDDLTILADYWLVVVITVDVASFRPVSIGLFSMNFWMSEAKCQSWIDCWSKFPCPLSFCAWRPRPSCGHAESVPVSPRTWYNHERRNYMETTLLLLQCDSTLFYDHNIFRTG